MAEAQRIHENAGAHDLASHGIAATAALLAVGRRPALVRHSSALRSRHLRCAAASLNMALIYGTAAQERGDEIHIDL
jgi:hypothetical protein